MNWASKIPLGKVWDWNMAKKNKGKEIEKTGPMPFKTDDKGDWISLTWQGKYTYATVTSASAWIVPGDSQWLVTEHAAEIEPTDDEKNDKKRELAARRDKWPGFFRFARNLERAVVNFKGESISLGDKTFSGTNEVIDPDPPLEEATGVNSKIRAKHNLPGMHKIVLDIDHEAVLVPSTTPGHHHLIIEHYMTWDAYKEILEVLGKHGVIEKGYAGASIDRGASWIRTPWTKKTSTESPWCAAIDAVPYQEPSLTEDQKKILDDAGLTPEGQENAMITSMKDIGAQVELANAQLKTELAKMQSKGQ